EPNAFVVLGGQGVAEQKYDTLAEAAKRASSGDIIEIRGNGPFVTDPIDFGNKAITIRAGAGHAPVLTANTKAKEGGALLTARSALALEGVELRYDARSDKVERYLISSSATLSIANCKLLLPSGIDSQPTAISWNSQSGRIRNSLIVANTGGY